VSGSDWVLVVVVLVLFVVSAFLALAETAFTRSSRIRAVAMEDEGVRNAGKLASMLEHPAQTLNALLLVILVCQFTSATLVGVLLERFGALAVAIGTVAEVLLFFVVAEVAPKTYAVQHTDRAALRITPMLWFFTRFPPLRALSRVLIKVANVILPGRGLAQGPFVTEEEIRALADVAASEDVIEREERALIHSIFEFGDTVVREVMQPRPDMVTIDADETIEAAIETAIAGGYSRLPASEGTPDEIVGLVFLKDLVRRARAGDGRQPVRGAVRPAVYVPEQKRVAELLRDMQTQHFHMAVVVDEYGAVAGLVTMEDLLEEIVGEIADEYDVEEPSVEHLADGSLRVPGRTPIDDVSEALGTDLPDTEWDTVAGLVFNLLGHVPVEGEVVHFQDLELRVERVQGRRIVWVRIRRTTPADTEATPAPPAADLPR
jgi:CBS domain containing-hemolysin-like protein